MSTDSQNCPQKGGLARPARTQQADEVPPVHCQVNGFESRTAPIAAGHASQLDYWLFMFVFVRCRMKQINLLCQCCAWRKLLFAICMLKIPSPLMGEG